MKPSRLYDAYELKHALKVKGCVQQHSCHEYYYFVLIIHLIFYIKNYLNYFSEGFLDDKTV